MAVLGFLVPGSRCVPTDLVLICISSVGLFQAAGTFGVPVAATTFLLAWAG